MNLGKAIRSIRKIKRMSQKELAYKSGIIQCTLCNIEKGRTNPTMYTLDRIAESLGVTQAHIMLFCVTEDELPQNRRSEGMIALETLKDIITDKQENFKIWEKE